MSKELYEKIILLIKKEEPLSLSQTSYSITSQTNQVYIQ